MKFVTALDFRNGAGGFAGISQRSAARSRPLRIAELSDSSSHDAGSSSLKCATPCGASANSRQPPSRMVKRSHVDLSFQ